MLHPHSNQLLKVEQRIEYKIYIHNPQYSTTLSIFSRSMSCHSVTLLAVLAQLTAFISPFRPSLRPYVPLM